MAIGLDKYTVKIVQPDPVKSPKISSITVSSRNTTEIEWIKQPSANIGFYNIYRESVNDDSKWIKIGKVSYSDKTSFLDVTSFPNIFSCRYTISAVNKCGEIFSPNSLKSIRLVVQKNDDNSNYLFWNSCEGMNVIGYKIYGGIDLNNLQLIDSISPSDTTFIDQNDVSKNDYYQIEAIGLQYDSLVVLRNDKTYTNVNIRSNVESLLTTKVDSQDISKFHILYNPNNSNIIVEYPFLKNQHYSLSLFDLLGNRIFHQLINTEYFEIDCTSFKPGIYILNYEGINSKKNCKVIIRNRTNE